jgi:hypothetical protein
MRSNSHWYQGDNFYGWADNLEELNKLTEKYGVK